MRPLLLLTAALATTLASAQWTRDEDLPDTEMPSVLVHDDGLFIGGVNKTYNKTGPDAPWETWNTITNDQVYVDAMAHFAGDLFAGTGGSHMFRANDADAEWAVSPGIAGLGAGFISCITEFQGTLYCGTAGGGTFRLVNGTWQPFGMLGDDQANNVYFLRVIGDTLWCGAGGNGYLFRITAGATDWTPVLVDAVTSISIEFTDLIPTPGALLAGGTSGTYRSTDNGVSWTWMAGPAAIVKFTWWNDVLIASRTGGTTRWFRSENGGISWTIFSETALSFGHAVYNGRFYSGQLDGLWYMESLPTSMEEIGPLSFELFPNPATEFITIHTMEDAPSRYIITDLQGRTVQQGRVGGPMALLDINDLSKGSYLLQLTTENRNAVRRFVVE